MSPDVESLEKSYRLIREFKEGKFETGSDMSAAAFESIRVLCVDLLPGVKFESAKIADLLSRLATEDSRWNRVTRETIDSIYSAIGQGNNTEADLLRERFAQQCPSEWYRQIVEDC